MILLTTAEFSLILGSMKPPVHDMLGCLPLDVKQCLCSCDALRTQWLLYLSLLKEYCMNNHVDCQLTAFTVLLQILVADFIRPSAVA